MSVSIYSVVSAVVFFNLALIVAFVMRRSSALLARRAVSFLLLTVFLGIVRLLLPIDFDRAIIVRSYQVLPAVYWFLKRPAAGSLSVASLLLVLWAVGTAAFLIRDLVRHLLFRRAIRNCQSVDRKDLIDLSSEFGQSFALMISPQISRPYVAGLFHPVIYLPDLELSEEQWRLILRHEVQHIRSNDVWKKLFFLVIQALFWWNPLAHISLREIDTLIELQCDAKLTADMSAKEVDRYLETLRTLKATTPSPGIPAAASALVWDQQQLVTRFQALQNAGLSRKRHTRVIAYLLLLALFVMSFFVIVQTAGFPDEAELLADAGEADEAFVIPYQAASANEYIIHKDGEYLYYFDDQYMCRIDEENLSDEAFSYIPIVEAEK